MGSRRSSARALPQSIRLLLRLRLLLGREGAVCSPPRLAVGSAWPGTLGASRQQTDHQIRGGSSQRGVTAISRGTFCASWLEMNHIAAVIPVRFEKVVFSLTYFKLGSSLGWGLSGSGKKTSFSKKNASTLGA